MFQTTTDKKIVALDVGSKRVGVSTASRTTRLASPLATLERGPDFWTQLQKLLTEQAADRIIVGLPRNLSGEETAQSATIRQFAQELATYTDLPITLQDETLSSRQAEEELKSRGKPYSKADIDSLAATLILEDYLSTN